MECFGLYWCKAMKETISLLVCHKHSAKKEKKRKENHMLHVLQITEKGKKDEIKTEYEKIV